MVNKQNWSIKDFMNYILENYTLKNDLDIINAMDEVLEDVEYEANFYQSLLNALRE